MISGNPENEQCKGQKNEQYCRSRGGATGEFIFHVLSLSNILTDFVKLS